MIESVKAENFQSWKDLSFDFDKNVTLISGFNYDDNTPEGSGKSAILNAVCWCLYGKLPKEAKMDEVIREGEKKCAVQVKLSNATIHRYRNPNELLIETADGRVLKGKDARETQKMIEQLVGMSFDTFCQTVYFAQNYNKKFVTSNQEERGKILSEIQELELFDKARKEVMGLLKLEDQKVNDLKHKQEISTLKLENNKRAIQDHKNFALQQEQQKQNQINQLLNTIKSKSDKLEELKQEMKFAADNTDPDKLAELEKDLNVVDQQINEIHPLISKAQLQLSEVNNNVSMKTRLINNLKADNERINKLNSEKDELNTFIKNPTKQCPTCGTELKNCDTSHAIKELEGVENKLQELYSGIGQIDQQIQSVSDFTDIDSINADISNLRNKLDQLQKAKKQITDLINLSKESQLKSGNISNMMSMIENDIVDLDKQLQSVNNQKIDNRAQVIGVLESENMMISEELQSVDNLLKTANERTIMLNELKEGFKEVKSYTFNSVLNELSHKSNTYLQELFEVPIKLRFTNENMKIGLDIEVDNQSRSFGLFSGGQQRRIGLAVDLALSDIVNSRTGHGIDLIILDEYFKDLSESSMQKCLSLLERLNRTTVLIEHNSLFKSIVNRTFEIELKDGVSCATKYSQ